MRHIFLLVAALGLIAVTGPSALAQDPDKPTSDPTTTPPSSEPATQPETPGAAPSALPQTYTQPATPGQAASPYAPATATPCGYIMPSAHVPGTVMYGTQTAQYQPLSSYSPMQTMTPPTPYGVTHYNQPAMQYGQPTMQTTAMPAMGAVTGGVISQPTQQGMTMTSGMTYPSPQPGMVYTNGMTYQPTQPGTVMPAGMMGTYPNQPIVLTGYSGDTVNPIMTTTQPARRGLFGRRR